MSDVTTTQRPRGSFPLPAFGDATVADAMRPGILGCDPDASLTDVARMMAINHVHCVAVMAMAYDESGESFVWGIISDLDLLEGRVGNAQPTARMLARQPIITVRPTTPLPEAGRAMLEHAVAHLVIVDPDTTRPIGIVSTLDLAGVLAWGEG